MAEPQTALTEEEHAEALNQTHYGLAVKLKRAQEDIEAEQKRGDMHSDINRRVAEVLGLDVGESWHDLDEKVRKRIDDPEEQLANLLSSVRAFAAWLEADHPGWPCPICGERKDCSPHCYIGRAVETAGHIAEIFDAADYDPSQDSTVVDCHGCGTEHPANEQCKAGGENDG